MPHRWAAYAHFFALAILFSCPTVSAAPPATSPVAGLRENTPAVHALTEARLVLAPGKVVEKGIVVLRDGVITAAGAEVKVPDDARVWKLNGKTIYPGFIDAYSEVPVEAPAGGAPYWNNQITPQLRVGDLFQVDSATNEKLRSQGIVARLVAPAGGIIKGQSAVVTTRDGEGGRVVLQPNVALHVRLGIPRGRGRGYPNSPMGAVALARQSLLDADWYGRAWSAHEANTQLPRPERNDALVALQPFLGGRQLVLIDAPNELYLLRAVAFAREFSLRSALVGSGQEYQQLEAVRATGQSIIVPLAFPRPPNVGTPQAAHDVELDELMHWDLAPENPGRLAKAGIDISLTTSGLRDTAEFLGALRTAVERGLSPDQALTALTVAPARLLGIDRRLGTLEAGKAASFVVVQGDLFDKKAKVTETWIDGERFVIDKQQPPLHDVAGRWKVSYSLRPGGSRSDIWSITRRGDQWQGSIEVQHSEGKAGEVKLNKLSLQDSQLSGSYDAKSLGGEGVATFSATVLAVDGKLQWTGTVLWPDGQVVSLKATRDDSRPADKPGDDKPGDDKPGDDKPGDDKPGDDKPGTKSGAKSEKEGEEKAAAEEKSGKSSEASQPMMKASCEVNYPLGAFGRQSPPEQPEHLLIRNATIWTCGSQGVISPGALLVSRGKIVEVGTDLAAPPGAVVVDAKGKHISPGLIDCHSHMATDGGVNESGQAITAEVRIGDFVNSNDIDIYRQLAGGLTSANVLHGSANPIGGQNQVIKLRWGQLFDELRFAEAPPGIKFALGENVKQSSSDPPTGRYPQSRMGVEQLIHNAFQSARQYGESWKRWEQRHDTLPPRRDLELETLLEILDGKRWVHCHSYRQDEILALLRTCEQFNIRIATLQHILEGYKVADAMAKHGAMGSAFSDWWAYKIEVYDAIPYAGALMHNAGVVVSFNSDDRELARHLNHEAAKAVKYGDVAPEEALKFVTLNPARQLRIDQYVGSLEAGKHADFVLWSGPPLSVLSRCEQTWIDGRKYFDRAEDQQLREEARRLRSTLVQKVLSSGQAARTAEESKKPDEELWPHEDLFCRARNLR